MQAIADTHLHLYPNYDIDAAFTCFLQNTSTTSEQIRIACLAERHDCHFFESIRSGDTQLEHFSVATNKTSDSAKELTLRSTQSDQEFTLLPGRQVISSENIEVLALACTQQIEDGLPAREIIKQVNAAGGLAVVAWSPGKWFFSRGKVVATLLDQFRNDSFVIGDTTLRPYFWPTPSLVNKAKRKGFKVIAGSDPLPFKGEESWYGAYLSVLDGDATSATDLVVGLRTATTSCVANEGKRSWPWQLLNRLKQNAASKSNG